MYNCVPEEPGKGLPEASTKILLSSRLPGLLYVNRSGDADIYTQWCLSTIKQENKNIFIFLSLGRVVDYIENANAHAYPYTDATTN